jgi:hypothetical protein
MQIIQRTALGLTLLKVSPGREYNELLKVSPGRKYNESSYLQLLLLFSFWTQ